MNNVDNTEYIALTDNTLFLTIKQFQIYDTFYIIVQNLISLTNHKSNIVAMKSVLIRFDSNENSIFFMISILLTKTSITSKITHPLLPQPHDRFLS